MKKIINYFLKFAASITIGLYLIACTPKNEVKYALKDAFKDNFLIGVAINSQQIHGKDSAETSLLLSQFNSIVAENAMKWEPLQPHFKSYNFTIADSFVALGQKHKMFIVGHNLLWHSQIPAELFSDAKGKDVSRDTLLCRLQKHIATIVGRYKGRVNGYDVVNEALNEDGTMRQSKWYKIIGEDYIEKAFTYAHEADSAAELYYNDYNIELPAKRAGAIKLVKSLQEKGIKINGIGIQGHWHLDYPSLADIDTSISEFAKLGIKVMITELDINALPRPDNYGGADVGNKYKNDPKLNPYKESFPDSMQQKLAKRYADIFGVFLKHKGSISRVTFWGLHDGCSWLNNWPVEGRTNYPLLFDRKLQPKPALTEVIKVVQK